MAWKPPPIFSRRILYWKMCHLLLRFLCLHEAAILALLVVILLARFRSNFLGLPLHLHFDDCSSGTLFSSRWSAMEYHRCQPPCACFIASDDPHSKWVKCMGFSHAHEAVYRMSKCTFCENLRLKTLHSRLEVFERESSVFPRHAPEASSAFRDLGLGCRAHAGEFAGLIHARLPISLPGGTRHHLLCARWCIIHSSLQLWGFWACFD